MPQGPVVAPGKMGRSDISLCAPAQSLRRHIVADDAATIVSGAMAERTHYWAYIVGSVVITALIYAVYGSWAWGSLYGGQGWLKQMGFIDFAGSTVVHSIGGWGGLAGGVGVGPRPAALGPR